MQTIRKSDCFQIPALKKVSPEKLDVLKKYPLRKGTCFEYTYSEKKLIRNSICAEKVIMFKK